MNQPAARLHGLMMKKALLTSLSLTLLLSACDVIPVVPVPVTREAHRENFCPPGQAKKGNCAPAAEDRGFCPPGQAKKGNC
jgi:hypothetical protein